jgi:peptide/nickel transport system substrate-binding protein
VLVRNPRFREWSPAGQPSGYPDRIAVTYAREGDASASDRQLTEVEQGRADLMSFPPTSRLNEISTRYAAQVHAFPARGLFGIFLNTRLPPFNNLKARQAFNYVIDRQKALSAFGGVGQAAITCQSVPFGMPGYEPYCPYTRNRTANGVWAGPDVARARKLVAASGTRGQRVIFWTSSEGFQDEVGKLAVPALKLLGYRASLKVIGHARYFDVVFNSRTRAQAGFFGWFPDYPATSSALMPLTCRAFRPASKNSVNASEFCNPDLDQAIDRALIRQTANAPVSPNATWVSVDRLATRLAPWVPLANPRAIVVVSRRVRNVQSNPQWGVLIDQIRVR